MMGFGFGGMFLFWGVLLALLAGGTALVIRLINDTRIPMEGADPTARQILDDRLARGEITREEYDLILARIER